MTNEPHKSIVESVLERIKQGKLVMRPRWHFVLKTLFGVAFACIVLLLSLYIVSFVLFALRESGAWFIPVFGFRGVLLFLRSLPWILLGVTVIFIVVLEVLVRRYSFSYRKPFLYSLLGVFFLVAIGAIAVERLRFHDEVLRFTKERTIPFVGQFYLGYGMSHAKNVHPVFISTTTEQGFLGRYGSGETIEVIISPDTRLPRGFDFIEGDEVVIIGDMFEGVIDAVGVAPMHERSRPMHREKSKPPFMRVR